MSRFLKIKRTRDKKRKRKGGMGKEKNWKKKIGRKKGERARVKEEKWEVSQRVAVVAGAVNNSYFTLILPEKFTFSATFYHSPYNGVPSSFFFFFESRDPSLDRIFFTRASTMVAINFHFLITVDSSITLTLFTLIVKNNAIAYNKILWLKIYILSILKLLNC